ncbi:hypothetical protein MT325_m669L [Paramecium bursaria chlorella virus MT325]|uniref:Uncharacterized protein m669L n=1 Tax=Paramecium bursaria Chlorella virus MT325 TaxID=346932 RepID=A7IV49_PBCVM|nr:hypothetical protein MT325_m669L [Paramecium bursaria chlorella virus MT325]
MVLMKSPKCFLSSAVGFTGKRSAARWSENQNPGPQSDGSKFGAFVVIYIYITLTFYYTFPRSFPLLSCLSLTNLVMARDAIAFLRLDIKNLSWSFSS